MNRHQGCPGALMTGAFARFRRQQPTSSWTGTPRRTPSPRKAAHERRQRPRPGDAARCDVRGGQRHRQTIHAVQAQPRRTGPSREAAAASAAHDMLLALYPDQKADLDTTLADVACRDRRRGGETKGIELGKTGRRRDHALARQGRQQRARNYRPATAAGVYVPTAIPVESTGARIKPWVMRALAVPSRGAAGAHSDSGRGPERDPRDWRPQQRQAHRRTDDDRAVLVLHGAADL